MAAAALAISCKKGDDPVPQQPATYGISTDDETFYELTFGKKKTVNFYAETRNGFVDGNNLTLTVKADPTLLNEFNKDRENKALLLPENAYSFASNELQIYKNNKKSLSTSLTVEMLYEMEDTLFVLPVTIASIEGSDKASVASDAPMFLLFRKKFQAIDKGKGTKDSPYLIYDKQDLLDMHEECLSSADDPNIGPTYFKMINDVDLEMTPDTEDSWQPLNAESPYKKKIVFDGNGKTIKNLVSTNWGYSSFFGVVYGEVFDVTFENAYIEHSSYAIGVVGGYVGTTDIPANVHNVKVVKSKVVNTGGNKNGVGGFCGRVAESTIDACSFDGEVESARGFVGGIAGYDAGTSTITNCFTSGKISTVAQNTGGIIGGIIKDNTAVKNCISTMGIYSTSFVVGGIAGHVNKDNKTAMQKGANEISGCIAWNDSLSVRKTTTANWSSGAIVGFTSIYNTLANCYRKPGLELTLADTEDGKAAAEYFKFVDQPNASESNPLTVGIDCDFSETHKSIYNGLVAPDGKTASDIAKQLGWDETKWNLSGSIPALK